MAKNILYLILIIGVLLGCIGCKSHRQLTEKSDTLTMSIMAEDTAMTQIDRTKTITIQKIDSMRTEITIKETLKENQNSRRHQRYHGAEKLKTENTDNLTPTLKKIERKVKNDSLRHDGKVKKIEAKQKRLMSTKDMIMLTILVVINLILIRKSYKDRH